MAACILHNVLRRNCNQYIRVGVDIESLEDGNISTGYRANNELLDLQIYIESLEDSNISTSYKANVLYYLQITNQGQSQTTARYVREQYMKYFNNEASVFWQNRFTYLITFTLCDLITI